MYDASRKSRHKSWQPPRRRVSVLAEMALRREKIVERLGELREANSLTQEEAARRVGVTHRQWQRWEAGESVPYPRNLDLVASKFGISVQEFFDGPPDGTALDRIEGDLARIEDKLDRILRQLGAAAFERELSDEADRPPDQQEPGSAAA